MSADALIPTLIAQLGGPTGLAAIVAEFSARVLADESLNYFFEGADPAHLQRHQAAVLTSALSDLDPEQRRVLRRGHQGLGINAAQFAAATGHLGAALEYCQVPPTVACAVIAAVVALQREVVGV